MKGLNEMNAELSTYKISLPDGKTTVAVIPYRKNVFRVIRAKKPELKFVDYNVLAPDCKPEKVDFKVAEGDGKIEFSTENACLSVFTSDGRLAFSNSNGKIYFAQSSPAKLVETEVVKHIFDGNSTVAKKKTADGEKTYAEGGRDEFSHIAYTAVIPLDFGEDEAVYGLGSQEDGAGNLRGKHQYLYQQNLRAFVPMMLSTYGYAVLFNCGCSMIFDDLDSHTISLDCVEELDVFLICGENHTAIMDGYYFLTGRPPMMPKYLFGYAQSREHYACADDLISTVAEYRRRQVPLDIIVQDWQYWRSNEWGQKSMDPERYPDPKAMIDELHNMHSKVQFSIWPTISGDDCKDAQEMLSHGFMLGNNCNYDAFNPDARKLYWKQTKEQLFDYGVDLWWCDCSEPFEADWQWEVPKPTEEERYKMNTDTAKKYIDRDKISLYCLYHTMGLYEGMRSCTDKRVATLTRSSFAGQHRYATITWSGDIEATWHRLRSQIPAAVNFTCTGEAYWSFDIGGFFAGKSNAWFWCGDYPNGNKDLGYRELYTRWLEYGAFLPMMRSHGTDTYREIWQFGEKGEMFYDAIEKNIRLRYSLLPYTYSLAAANTFRSSAIILPLGLVFPKDKDARDNLDQYMFGDIMVCPVTEPMYYDVDSKPIENKQKRRKVYLPEGTWYDFHTNKKLSGGKTIEAEAPIDIIPLFVRAGSIIVTAPVMQYTNEIENPVFTVTVYDGADGNFILYNDDSETYAYEKGEYEEIAFNWNDGDGILTIEDRNGSYKNMPRERTFDIKLAGKDSQRVVYNGSSVSIKLK